MYTLHVAFSLLLLSSLKGEVKSQDLLLPSDAVGSNINESKSSPCPTWYTRTFKNDDIWCVCNDTIVQGGSVIRCPKKDRICLTCEEQQKLGRNDLNVSILTAFCMTHNFSTQQTLLAACPYNHHSFSSSDFFVTLPSNLSDLNEFMCDFFKRQGDLCKNCADNKEPNMFSAGVCLNTHNSTVFWFYFIALELVPPTVVFSLILFCKVRATSGPLNAFIFFCQMFYVVVSLQVKTFSNMVGYTPQIVWNSTSEAVKNSLIQIVGGFYSLWYDQVLFNINFGLVKISTMQVVAIQYLPSLFPLFLIVLSYIIVRLHYNGCRVMVYMWKPFEYCKSRLGINWEPLSSIIHTFATFILLAYTKIIEVSYYLLAPSRVYNQTGELPYMIMSYDASIHFLDHKHLPYVILALSMLTIFCGLPLLVLFLYPMACFQRLLSKTISPHIRQMLRIFTEAYTGCYKDKTMPHQSLDCRYFASLYFLFRVVYLTCLFFVEYSYVWLALIVTQIFIALIFGIIQPYKSKWLNVVDSTFFALAGLATLLYAYNIHIATINLWIPTSFVALPLLYFIAFISFKIFLKIKGCCVQYRAKAQNEADEDQRMFQREAEVTERSRLINPVGTDLLT